VSTILEAPPERRPATRLPNGKTPPPLPPTGGDDDGHGRDPEPHRPFIDNARLATMFLIAAETMLFAGLVSGFFVLRLGAPVWPPPLQPRLPVALTGVNTLVLIGSSVAMVLAGRALARGDRGALTRRLGIAGGLGATFLVMQGVEWVRLIGFGLTMSSHAYGTTFYMLIGAHALHVIGALGWLAIVFALAARGRFAPDRAAAFRACAMYWHFVVGLWPLLYVAVYLL